MNTMNATKVLIPAKVLTAALKACARVVPKRVTIPVLAMAQMRGTSIVATDFDCSVCVVVGDYHDANFLIPVRQVLEALKTVSKDAEVSLMPTSSKRETAKETFTDWVLHMSADGLDFQFPTLDVVDFPERVLPRSMGPQFQMPAEVWQRMFAQVEPAISDEDSRYTLHAALLMPDGNDLDVVTTDGHRLHLARQVDAFPQFEKCLIPADAIRNVQALMTSKAPICFAYLPAKDDKTISHCEFQQGNVSIVARCPAGQFPNYMAVMPKDVPNECVLPVQQVISAVKRMMSASKAQEPNRRDPVNVILSFESGEVHIILSPTCKVTLPAPTVGNVKVRLNAQYVLDILSHIGEGAMMAAKDSESAVLFRGDNARFVLMPIRL
jgi:DNA polymerase III subunit beta